MDDFDKLLLDYIVAISAPTVAPHFAALAIIAVIALAIAVMASQVLVVAVLRLSPIAFAMVVPLESSRPRNATFPGSARARAPSLAGVFIRA